MLSLPSARALVPALPKRAAVCFKQAWTATQTWLPGVAGCRHFSDASGTPRILRSDSTDITFHFALEEYLMQRVDISGPLMYLWRPAPVITIGRHQNPWKECVLSQMEADGVALVRRRSGGGAVWMDLGNSVFSLIAPTATFDIDNNFSLVLGALQRLGVKAERSGRNDILVDGRKMSGSAFKHLKAPDRKVSLHHGTILVDTDMTALQRYLTPDKRKLQAKGVKSVGARVMNLQNSFPNVTHDAWTKAMIEEFCEVYDAHQVQVEDITADSEIAQEAAFREFHAEVNDKEWRFGRTPNFSHQLETRIEGVGIFDVRLQVVAGCITEATIFSDVLYPDVIDKAMQALTGVDYGRLGVRTALEGLRPHVDEGGPTACLDALLEWIVANVDD
mmetsp:Transcript_108205/g.187298  ORF Transcript_108205/g.187298 Transcript_108205/m.187298 type:complete len:390 (+) Transcript_108205:58-1227(+)